MRKEDEKGISEKILATFTDVTIKQVDDNSIVYTFPNLEIKLNEQSVCKNGRQVSMSKQEFLALCFLAEHPGWVRTKEQIYETVYGHRGLDEVENSVYCLIYSLRKKLETDPQHPQYIQTVRSIGYKFTIPDK